MKIRSIYTYDHLLENSRANGESSCLFFFDNANATIESTSMTTPLTPALASVTQWSYVGPSMAPSTDKVSHSANAVSSITGQSSVTAQFVDESRLCCHFLR